MNQLHLQSELVGDAIVVSGVLTTFDGDVVELCHHEPIAESDEVGGVFGSIAKVAKGAVKAVTHPKATVKKVSTVVTHPKTTVKALKKVADTASSIVRNKYVAAATISVATATGVGAPAAAAYAAALAATTSYEAGKKYVGDAQKVAKAAGIVKGDSKAVADAKLKKASASVQKAAASLRANGKVMAQLDKTLKLAKNLAGMKQYGAPGQKAKAERNSKVIALVQKEQTERAKLAGKVPTSTVGLVITLDGKLLKGKVTASPTGAHKGYVLQNGKVAQGAFNVSGRSRAYDLDNAIINTLVKRGHDRSYGLGVARVLLHDHPFNAQMAQDRHEMEQAVKQGVLSGNQAARHLLDKWLSATRHIVIAGLGDQPHDLALETDHLIKLWEKTHGVEVSGSSDGPHKWLMRYKKAAGTFDRKQFARWLKLAAASADAETAGRMRYYADLISVEGRRPKNEALMTRDLSALFDDAVILELVRLLHEANPTLRGGHLEIASEALSQAKASPEVWSHLPVSPKQAAHHIVRWGRGA